MDKLYGIYDFTDHKYCPRWEVWFIRAPGYQSINTKSFATEQEAHAYAKTLQEEA